MVSTVARDGVEVTDLGEQGELYSVACIHCGKRVFRFSDNLFRVNAAGYGCGDVTFTCPLCNGKTKVIGNGEIQAG